MTTAKRALDRVREANRALEGVYRQKIYRLRGICAGDSDASAGIGYAPSNNSDPGTEQQRANRKSRPDIQVSRFAEGRDNTLLNILIGLVGKTCYNFPRVELSGVKPNIQVVNAQYLKSRLGPSIKGGCNAVEHGKIALMDYLMGGMGVIYLPVEAHGKPGWRWADTLDFTWDQQARLPCDITWASITVNQPLAYWMSIPEFAKSTALQKFASGQPRRDSGQFAPRVDDRPCELEFYYDCEEEGAYKVFLKTGDITWDDDPVFEDKNPHRIDVYGEDRPFLPFESAFFAALPSVRLPIGVAEKMLPAQIAVWRITKRIQSAIDYGKAFWKIKQGALSTDQVDAFLQAYEGGVVFYNPEMGEDAISSEAPLNIDQTDLEELQRHLQNMQMQGGLNNYAFGAPVGKPKFSREVAAMIGQGELIPGSVSQSNARMWEAATIKFLANGKKWDESAFSCLVDDQRLSFGTGKPRFNEGFMGPIAEYLEPGADLSISEDSMKFMPRQQRIQEAMMDLRVAGQLAQAGFPNAVERAARRFYEAMGVDDIEERLKKPAVMPGMPPGMPAQPGQAPGASPTGAAMSGAQQGEASTV